jgi:hypothetical protein
MGTPDFWKPLNDPSPDRDADQEQVPAGGVDRPPAPAVPDGDAAEPAHAAIGPAEAADAVEAEDRSDPAVDTEFVDSIDALAAQSADADVVDADSLPPSAEQHQAGSRRPSPVLLVSGIVIILAALVMLMGAGGGDAEDPPGARPQGGGVPAPALIEEGVGADQAADEPDRPASSPKRDRADDRQAGRGDARKGSGGGAGAPANPKRGGGPDARTGTDRLGELIERHDQQMRRQLERQTGGKDLSEFIKQKERELSQRLGNTD